MNHRVRRLDGSTSSASPQSSSTSLLIVGLCVLGAVVLGLLACLALRRYRLKQKRLTMQRLMDEAILEAGQNDTQQALVPNHPVMDTTIEQIVVGEADDFVIMGANKPRLKSKYLKTASTASSMASQSIMEEPSSVASDDTIIIMQSMRGGSNESLDALRSKARQV
ncbi:hypothetical protein THRCLA_04134 [Thraustotheca clavata]|uniref:Uncharacterized protein n=1 Tax=Thraustotheca clavata TaxID=74557 RepID=A0A1V9ZZV8_9STRA|nr:hypothetical protein THRCLA_04134 [Thraustotheca clavata]